MIHRLSRPLPILALLAALLTGVCAFGAAPKAPPRRPAAVPPNPKSKIQNPKSNLSLVWTGDQNGHLEPCGCAKPQLGGMLRRASYLKSRALSGLSLRLDNGDLTEARGRQDELKAETSFQLLDQLAYAAINLGEKEFRLGLPYLQYLASSFKGAVLCANARDAADQPVFKEYTQLDFKLDPPAAGPTTEQSKIQHPKSKIRSAVIGLLSDQFAPEVEALNPGLKIAPAGDTLDRLRPALEDRELVIVLFHGEPEEARRLVAGQDWIDAVIAAHAPDDRPQDLSKPGEPHLLTVGKDGKHLGLAEIGLAQKGQGTKSVEGSSLNVDGPETERLKAAIPSTVNLQPSTLQIRQVRGIPLGPEIAGDPDARAVEAAYLRRVAEERLLDKLPRVPVPNDDRFVGTAACKSCHAGPHKVWTGSTHSKAWETLVKVGHDKDPDCVGCHVVGLEFKGGFVSAQKTPHLEDVGCESCHRAAGRHAANPAAVRPPKVGAASCATCHVPEHSPNFDFTKYWAMIRH